MDKLSPAFLLFLAVSQSAQTLLNPDEERGRQVYEHGTSPSHASLEASLPGGTRIAGSVVPCMNCHGYDGLGRPESGVVPPNITRDALTKPYGLKDSQRRVRPPYTDRLLKRAITMGIDSGGNTLDAAMPRFQLSLADASDLVAYMKKLGGAVDPGLTDTAVRVGVVLPPTSQDAATAGMVKQAFLDSFARVNAAGGIFGRHIDPIFTELPQTPALRAGWVRNFLHAEPLLAVLGDFSGAEPEIAAVMRSTGTPAIATFAPFPRTSSPLNRFVFYLDGGVEEEEQALLDLATKRFPGSERRIAIICSRDESSRDAATWLEAQLYASGRRQVVVHGEEKPVRADIVFWVRTGVASSVAIGKTRANDAILISGSLTGVPAQGALSSDQRVFLAFGPGLRSDELNEPSRLLWDRATASASLFIDALKTAGHGVSRASLLETLEGVRGVQTNLPLRISFGPNRRVGTSYVRMMTIDRVSRKIESIPPDESR